MICWRDELAKVLRAWAGAPYSPNGRTRDGVNCIGFVFAVLDELYQYRTPTNAIATHDSRQMVRAARRWAEEYPHEVIRGGTIESGDVLLVRSWMGSPSHLVIAGRDPRRLWHATRKAGVCWTGAGQFEIARHYRPIDKQTWRSRS